MKRAYLLPILLFLMLMLIALPSKEEIEHPKPTYVGAAKCKVCHLETFDSWKKTDHAKALASLGEEQATDSACLVCHTTGYDDGGYATEGTLVDLGGVQCEACHGAGSLYSRSSVMRQPTVSRELGLASIDSATCAGCHNENQSPAFKGFSYKAGLSTGTHQRKPVRGSTTTP